MAWKREPLEEPEMESLLETAGDLDLELEFTVRGLIYTGMRASEFAHMRSDWVDWQSEEVRVPMSDGDWSPKTHHAARTIPIRDPDTIRVMREYFKRNEAVGVTRKAIYERVVKVANQTEIPKKITPHVLRHTYGTMIARKGATAQYIRQTMGHADLSSANAYIRYTGRELHEEADTVFS